ncbi:vWA domain-containing protein [Ruminococcus albus]|uniref:von Willebrand factor type A domain protein n=1 Tax=Ruminococcus albus 8 TaxID=246199 RepID=E9S7F6_RUMAL|nr:von Willebrand factor type A domain-containing protein [Ruminococcus albus]EGC04768.1 von Willebrand factor type A domain protein [Ruminococcus albus 8]MCC3349434.1 von Willebrand factor type A domain-containing protein [Ruminococcus albus 8]
MKENTKRIFAMAAAIMMTVTMFASCGSASDSTYKAENDTNITNNDVKGGKSPENITADAETDGGEFNYYTEEAIPEINTEEYNHYAENSFQSVAEHPLSTFSTDVDTASFTNVRRMIENRQDIFADAVRTEEFINYFKYDYPQPDNDDKIGITTELSDCPWNDESKLMLVGLQAKDIDVQDIDSNIVFLIDVSGSMGDANKLPLVAQAFAMLAENLGQNDRISIVTYAGRDTVELEGESGANYSKIAETLAGLTAGGSTAGAAGINTAYELAQKYFIEGGNNRVILATDGDLNVGLSSQEELTALIEEKRDMGIFLSVLGFGMGNYKDSRLEALADNGNGNYAYIDSIDEAERVLVTEMNGTMFTVAKDAKVQVEFNPANVSYYRLVGYENRLLDDRDFEDDTKDAGDVGAGQQVTALYEIIPTEAKAEENTRTLKYQDDVAYPEPEKAEEGDLDRELLTVSVRYKEKDENDSKLVDKPVMLASYVSKDEMSDNMKLASAAAMFAKTLGNSEDKFTMAEIREQAMGLELNAEELLKLISDYETNYENKQ